MTALGFTLSVLISVAVVLATFVGGFFCGIATARGMAKHITGKSLEELVKANRKPEPLRKDPQA